MLIGFTLCKNFNKYQYPIELCIKQHKDLLDQYWFIVPELKQDEDGTRKTIIEICKELNFDPKFFEVDWPGEKGFGKESIDKILQQEFVNTICPAFSENTWFIKLDADEFIHEKDFPIIRGLIKEITDMGVTSIAFNYRQFLGSVEYTCFDPTERTSHLFKNGSNAAFHGNDAMNLASNGDEIYLEEVYINHIGYVKPEELLSIKLREHFILNESVYKDVSNKFTNPDDVKFEFPQHQINTRLWPLGIACLRGFENKIEYKKFDTNKLPRELKENIESLRFFIPEIL